MVKNNAGQAGAWRSPGEDPGRHPVSFKEGRASFHQASVKSQTKFTFSAVCNVMVSSPGRGERSVSSIPQGVWLTFFQHSPGKGQPYQQSVEYMSLRFLSLGKAEPQLGQEERRVKQKERRVKN